MNNTHIIIETHNEDGTVTTENVPVYVVTTPEELEALFNAAVAFENETAKVGVVNA